MNRLYLDTARLLTQVAPLVFVDETFALKSGSAKRSLRVWMCLRVTDNGKGWESGQETIFCY